MAFMVYQQDDGRQEAWEYLPCAAITPKIGMALVPNADGNLAIATGTSKPTYISQFEAAAALAAGTIIPVIRVNGEAVYRTQNSADFSSVKRGNRVTLHASNGLEVTATTASGVAEVVDFDGTAVGSNIYVRF